MSPELSTPRAMRAYRFDAMGTEVRVLLPSCRGDGITVVRELFADWEARLSRFLPDSELSRLNSRAGQPVIVSQVVFDAVTAGVEAARATDGIFDPTVLPQLKRIGYSRSFAQMPTELDPARGESRAGGGWQRIMLDPRSRTVVLPSGCALDLGGIAKGMAVDRALELLRARGVDAALVSAGGDLSVLGLPPEERGWSVLVGDDAKREIVPLIRGALATSGIARRSWLQAGVRRHHLLDPRTGEPAANDLHEVTVAAETCEVAEVAATVCFVLGSRLGADFIAALHLAARLIGRNGSHLSAGSWPTPVQDAA